MSVAKMIIVPVFSALLCGAIFYSATWATNLAGHEALDVQPSAIWTFRTSNPGHSACCAFIPTAHKAGCASCMHADSYALHMCVGTVTHTHHPLPLMAGTMPPVERVDPKPVEHTSGFWRVGCDICMVAAPLRGDGFTAG